MEKFKINDVISNLYELTSKCIKNDDIIKINTSDGDVIMMSEVKYNSLIESLLFARIPGMYESIIEGANTPLEKCQKLEIN